jgi:hypothetical protein
MEWRTIKITIHSSNLNHLDPWRKLTTILAYDQCINAHSFLEKSAYSAWELDYKYSEYIIYLYIIWLQTL